MQSACTLFSICDVEGLKTAWKITQLSESLEFGIKLAWNLKSEFRSECLGHSDLNPDPPSFPKHEF